MTRITRDEYTFRGQSCSSDFGESVQGWVPWRVSLEYGERVSPAPRDALPRMFFPQIAQNITDRRHFTELATGGLCNSSNTWSSLTFRQSWSTLPPGCQHWAILGRSLAEVDGRLARHLPKHCCGSLVLVISERPFQRRARWGVSLEDTLRVFRRHFRRLPGTSDALRRS